jgi:hypothetical protein
MRLLTRCEIVTQDDIHPTVDFQGKVVIFGDSPNARVRLSYPDFTKKKFVQLDLLTEAKVTEKNDMFIIEGKSWFLRNVIKASIDESWLKFSVTPGQECEDCK